MSLQDRNIDQKVNSVRHVGDTQLHAGAVDAVPFFLLRIHKGYMVGLAELPVSAVLIGLGCAVSDPGAFCDNDIFKAMFLQIFDDARNHLGMRGSAVFGGRGHDKVRLNADPCAAVADQLFEFCILKKLDGDRFKVCSVDFDNLVFLNHIHSSICHSLLLS